MRFEQQSEESGTLTAPGLQAGYSRQERGIVWYVQRVGFQVRGTVATVAEAQERIIRNLQGARPVAARGPRPVKVKAKRHIWKKKRKPA